MYCPIVPAIIPESQTELISMLSRLNFVNEIQIDVVDGVFAPTASWPYEPQGSPIAVKTHTDPFTLEVDLMTVQPLLAAKEWIAAGADMLVFHIESISLEEFTNFIDHTPVTVGVSMSGSTTLESFLPYAKVADYVQLMGIETIGSQGQSFDEEVLNTIKAIKQEFPNKLISIDGSVNKDTIIRLRKAGAERFVSGSAIVKQDNPEAPYNELCTLVNE